MFIKMIFFAGVGFRPMPDREKYVESTLIQFRHGSQPWEEWQPWVDRLSDHLKRKSTVLI